jgi:hypothetical protein
MSLQSLNKVIELSAYVQPKISEDKREDWVNYGEDNNYYQFLIERFLNSATNNAIINNICKLIYGEGLYAKDSFQKPEDWANVISIISQEELKKLIIDLYLLGQGSLQVHYNDKHDKVIEIFHIPQQLLRPAKCNEDGEIVTQYYSDNWQDVKKFKPKAFPVFGTSKEKIEILTIQPYSVGMKYFSYVDYQGALDYAVLEEKIAEYLINEVNNGFSPTTVLNFNNGQPADQEKDDITNRIMNQLTGSTGKKLVVSFNDNEATKTTIDSVPLNDAPEHYAYLSEECRTKIMVGHNVVSPLIFGIATSTGFSANADELQNSFTLYENMVIKPKQQLIIDSLKKIFRVNDINLDLAFKSLNPFALDAKIEDNAKQITDAINSLSPLVANKVIESMTNNEIRGLVGLMPISNNQLQTLSSHKTIDDLDVTKYAIDEDLSDYEMIYCEDVDYDTEKYLDEQINDLNNRKESFLSSVLNFVKTGTARPNTKSEQDGEIFKSRYRYVGDTSEKSREFCVKMTKANKLYRKEDIIAMESQAVNAGFGPEGADNYSIWLYKGGGACHHRWQREIYLRKSDVNSPLAKTFTPSQTRKKGEIAPTNNKLVYTRPIDMPNKGFLPK